MGVVNRAPACGPRAARVAILLELGELVVDPRVVDAAVDTCVASGWALAEVRVYARRLALRAAGDTWARRMREGRGG